VGWTLFAVISAVAAGATAVFAKAGLEEVAPNLGNTIRTAMVLMLSAAVLVWSGEHQAVREITTRSWVFLALSGVATTVSWVAFFKALSLGPATPVTAVDRSSLVVTMLLGAWLLGEELSWRTGVGVALMIAGALVVSSTKS